MVLSHFSRVQLFVTLWTDCSLPGSSVHGILQARMLEWVCPWNSPGKNTGVGCYSLLQGIFLTQGSNLGLPHCRQIFYHLSHLGSPLRGHQQPYQRACRLQDWVASSQTTAREGGQPHPSSDNRIKVLLIMALPTRATPSFPHSQSFPSRSLHKPLSLIHQRADRRNKNYNPSSLQN